MMQKVCNTICSSFSRTAWKLVFFGLALIFATVAHAQTTSGSFVGRVTDPTGSVVPGATVKLTNEATSVATTQVTNGNGEYTFSYIQPGTYTLAVSAQSFSASVINHINLDIQQIVREDFALKAGSATSTVTVTAATPLIQTDSSYVGNIVDGKQIQETPLNGRENAYSLLGLAPGVQRPNSNALISGSSFKGGANQTIDGVSNDDIVNARMSDQVPSLEAMAEFNTIGVNAPAEYGNGGAQVIIVTKSGTNAFHGTLFEFNRNRYFQARNFFLVPGSKIPPFNRNEYGGSIGGPVLKDKLFFFFTYENIHSLTTVTRQYAMPTPEFLTGDFSKYTSLAGKPTIIYNPFTKLPFPNNTIPSGMINATSQKFLSYYSAPNTTTATGLGNNFTYSSPTLELDPRWSIRGDYQIDTKDHVMFRFYANRRIPAPYDVGGTDKFGNYKILGNIINQFAGSYTRVISSRMVNEFIFGLNKRADPRIDQNNNVDPTQLVAGLPPTASGYGLLPTVNIAGMQKIFSTGSSTNHQHTLQFDDNLSVSLGSHNLKFGGQFLSEYEGGTSYNTGSFSFDGRYTGQYTTTGQSSNEVNAFADFLLGYMDSSSTANKSNTVFVGAKTYAAYATDTWNATPKLTINYGLRYDKLFPFQVTQGGLATFDPQLGALVTITGTPDPALVQAYPTVDGSTVGYNLHNWLHMQNINFAPRLGFAYRPFDSQSFVLRGGYGIFYNNLSLAVLVNNLSNQLPFILSTSYIANSNTVPNLTFDNPFPTTGASAGNPNASGVQRDLKTPYNQQFNLTVEDEVWKKIAVRASYVGNLGTHLHTPYPLNDVIPQPIGGPGQPATVQAARPFQPFGNITYYLYGESTNTNQLQLAARRRFSGLTFDLEYQYTKALGIDGPNDETVTNKLDIRQDYGNLDYYARHALALNYSYSLPIGRGQWLLGNANAALDRIVGGWKFSGVWKATSGTPFSVSFNSSLNGFPSGRANFLAGTPTYPAKKTYKQWFNASAFAVPANYTFGNSQRNMMFGPSFSEWDAALLKDLKITERVNFQFRAEAFDVLNRANFGNPAANVSVPATIGQISSTSADNRELQFGGRISF